MYTVKTQNKATCSVDYRAVRPFTIKPEVKKTFFEGKGKDKTRMYLTTDGRSFNADMYDKNFKVDISLAVKPKHFKSKSIDARVID